jgi:hypothetical protein
MQKLRRENQRLTEELRKAAIVIDVQKVCGVYCYAKLLGRTAILACMAGV